ncbi:MAG: choline/carnitine O-acyltransferase, partial [Nocardiopsaceae bacterium]|nr:choline/carnitine O-acyltransferase [Nocardiopsaceae bacterium]
MDTSPDGTFGNETRLPRVPLPSVGDTCARFLEWCSPLLTPAEVDDTRRVITNFLADPDTARVHEALASSAGSTGSAGQAGSWLDEFWRDRYLGRRDRIALNANFFFLFNEAPEHDQIGRAVALVTAAVDYKLRLDAAAVPPATRRGQPLSMEQHRYLFGTTRIPGETRDGVRAPYGGSLPPVPGELPPALDGPSDARHILVLARGAMYAVDVIAPGGRPYGPDEIAAALRQVTAAAAAAGRGQG